ncbi:hypothetical protein FQN60_009140 [Etheostoma spectabile]|uniref:Phosphatidic acid phosphatase type 2/haloperoxidase domain-containing protein n=1 Tax=Etheostoma spectabile TaxID=54343 RepID=A0A5J5CPU0_9PERO|nr:hypothetical protein FQN60_009140 [Etheostoma spectabile]
MSGRNIWTRVTDLSEKKHALAAALGLEGRAGKRERWKYPRIPPDYIIDFGQRYNRMKKYNMTLPDAILAFKLLDMACLDQKSRRLALTACTELKFSSMKSALIRISGGKTTGSLNGIEMNQDVAFFTQQRPQGRGRRNATWQSGQLRQPLLGTNPLEKFETQALFGTKVISVGPGTYSEAGAKQLQLAYPFSLGFCLAPCWCLLVCVSRIYMGMHSVLDRWMALRQQFQCAGRPPRQTLEGNSTSETLFKGFLWPLAVGPDLSHHMHICRLPSRVSLRNVMKMLTVHQFSSESAMRTSLEWLSRRCWPAVREDVIAGVLYSGLILLVFLPLLDLIDGFNLTCRYAPLIIICLHLGLGLFSFTLDTWSTSRGDTAQILGTGAGVALASHVNHYLGLMPDPTPDQLPFALPGLSAGLAGAAVLRLVLGVLVLMATRALMKAVTIPLVCRVFGVPSTDVRKARQHMEVELPYRYLVYGAVGFNVLFLVPFLFSCIRLS